MARSCKASCECNREYAIWEACGGEAHSNPHIDNCSICAPHWGSYPTCPNCYGIVTLVESSNPEKLYCRVEKKHYYR